MGHCQGVQEPIWYAGKMWSDKRRGGKKIRTGDEKLGAFVAHNLTTNPAESRCPVQAQKRLLANCPRRRLPAEVDARGTPRERRDGDTGVSCRGRRRVGRRL